MSFLVPVSVQRSQCRECDQYRGVNPEFSGMEQFAGESALLVNCLLAEAADSDRAAVLEVVERVKQAVGPCTATEFVEDSVKWGNHFD